MIQADQLLDDEDLVEVVFQAQGRRHAHSGTLGRAQTPAETVLRLLLLKHVRNWSFDTLERQGDTEPGVPGVCTHRSE